MGGGPERHRPRGVSLPGVGLVKHNEAVWITGVGMATPLGNSYAAVADNLLAGKSGIRRVTEFDVSSHLCQIAGRVEPFTTPPGLDRAEFARLDPPQQMLLWCCTQALQDAGWWERRGEVRLGLALGIGAEWLPLWEADRFRGGNRVH